jgi:hypothetical protein
MPKIIDTADTMTSSKLSTLKEAFRSNVNERLKSNVSRCLGLSVS